MDHDTLRSCAHALADWIADYRAHLRERPVVPHLEPGAIAAALPEAPPSEGEPFARIFEDFERLILPGISHWNHPRWFAYFPANTSGPAILAETLAATLGAQCMSWQTSPAATELEQVVTGWLRELIGLPAGFHGVIQDTASSATLVALLVARERATGWRFKEEGAAAPGAARLRVYASEEAHSSVEKGVMLGGFGRAALRRVPVDGSFAMDAGALTAMVAADRAAGLLPAAVVATIGTTSSTAIDPLPAIGAFCAAEGIFLHVDAAFAGSAAILPERRDLTAGAEHADSFVFNPHKWLMTTFDCSAHFVRDREALLRTCRIDPEYLRTDHDDRAVNYRDWGIPLGRRFRALKLWFVLRSFGVEGLRRILRRHLALAQEAKTVLEADGRFEIAAPVPLSLVCFRLRPRSGDGAAEDDANAGLLREINEGGEVFLTHTRLGGKLTLRLAIGQELTGAADVRTALDRIRAAAGRVLGRRPPPAPGLAGS